jgi:hypothetical protein
MNIFRAVRLLLIRQTHNGIYVRLTITDLKGHIEKYSSTNMCPPGASHIFKTLQ